MVLPILSNYRGRRTPWLQPHVTVATYVKKYAARLVGRKRSKVIMIISEAPTDDELVFLN